MSTNGESKPIRTHRPELSRRDVEVEIGGTSAWSRYAGLTGTVQTAVEVTDNSTGEVLYLDPAGIEAGWNLNRNNLAEIRALWEMPVANVLDPNEPLEMIGRAPMEFDEKGVRTDG